MIDRLNRAEILRYLGYKDSCLTESMVGLLDRCEREALEIIQPQYIYKRFPIRIEKEGVRIEGTSLLLTGRDIREHLKNCRSVFLLGATIGMALDRQVRRYMVMEPDAGVVMDSCGIQAVEQTADLAERELESIAEAEGCHLTWRFSPGYGDFPLEVQRDLMFLLDSHRKIGVSLTESCLMVPSKSVTAILGVSDTKRDPRENKCDFCNSRKDCQFRKRGTRC